MDLDDLVFVDLGSDVLVRVDQVQAVVPRREHPKRSRVMVGGRWVDCDRSVQSVRERLIQAMQAAVAASEGA